MIWAVIGPLFVFALIWFGWSTGGKECTDGSKFFRGKKVLITGAAQGLGKEIAFVLAKMGVSLVLWDLNPLVCEVARNIGNDAGIEAHGYSVDVSVADDVANTQLAMTQDRCSSIDVLINNAGCVSGKSVLTEGIDDIMRVLGTNFLSCTHTTKAFVPGMQTRGYGHVVNISSVMSTAYSCDLSSYCASKAALKAWHNCFRLELARDQSPISTTLVMPYAINTGMFNGATFSLQWALPILEVKEVAAQIVHAIIRKQEELTIHAILGWTLPLSMLLPTWILDSAYVMAGSRTAMNGWQPQNDSCSE